MEIKQRMEERANQEADTSGPASPANSSAGTSVDESATIRTLLAHLAVRKSDPLLKGIDGVYQIEVEGFGSWFLTVRTGSLAVSRSPVPVDCAIVFSAEDFIDIARGRQNLMTAFLQGRVSGWGDLGMALAFRRLLPLST